MINTIIAGVALLAASASAQLGSAIVVNNCAYPVTLTNVPSSGGGQSQIGPNTLQSGGSYSQQYTPLTNNNGWSMKLSLTPALTSLLQFEYTYQNDDTVWWDLSAVNGDPFVGDWVLSANNGCAVKQTAYLFPTDDAQGEQSCPSGSSVTVTLCGTGSGSAPASGPASDPASSPSPAPSVQSPPESSPSPQESPASPAPSDPAPTSPPSDPSPTSPPAAPSTPVQHSPHFGQPGAKENNAAQFSTLATQAKVVDVVTNVHTTVVTQYVTVSPSPVHKRQEEHLHRHAHFHDRF